MQLSKLLLALSLSSSALSTHLSPQLRPRQSNSTSILVSPKAANTTLSNTNGTTIIINDNQTSSDPLDIQCASVQKLTVLSSLDKNATLLQEASQRNNLTASQVATLQASAQSATAELTNLEASNSNLAGTCANSRQVSRDCAELTGLSNLDAVATDPVKLTALQQMQNLSPAQVDELRAAAANSRPLLQSLQTNQTLVDQCSKFVAARTQGQGIANAAAVAVGGTAIENGNGNGANVTVTITAGVAGATGAAGATGGASATGSPMNSSSGPFQNGGPGAVPAPEFGYGLMGTAILLAVGMVLLG